MSRNCGLRVFSAGFPPRLTYCLVCMFGLCFHLPIASGYPSAVQGARGTEGVRCGQAAEEAKKRADILEEQTRPARERVGAGVGAGASAIGRVISKVAEQPAVRAVGRAAASGVQGVVGAAEAIDAKSREIERKIAESATATSVREALGEDSRLKRVEGKEIDAESDGLVIREETPWERRVRKLRESAWVGPVFEGAVAARQGVREGVGRMGDRVFGETCVPLPFLGDACPCGNVRSGCMLASVEALPPPPGNPRLPCRIATTCARPRYAL
jgi:hypothetical protein